jgi:hypothetical protein
VALWPADRGGARRPVTAAYLARVARETREPARV